MEPDWIDPNTRRPLWSKTGAEGVCPICKHEYYDFPKGEGKLHFVVLGGPPSDSLGQGYFICHKCAYNLIEELDRKMYTISYTMQDCTSHEDFATYSGIPPELPSLPMTDEKTLAKKNDQGKLRFDLIPVLGMMKLAEVYTIGKAKYGKDNWRLSRAWSDIIRAMESHLQLFKAGEQNDPKDGQHHLASVAWGCFTLIEYELTHPEMDDRNKDIPAEALRKLVKGLEEIEPKKE